MVMKEGRVVAEFPRDSLTEDNLIHAAHLDKPDPRQAAAGPAAAGRDSMLKNLHGRAADFIFAAPLTAAFIVMFAFFAMRGEGFFDADNLENVALQSAALCIVAVAIGLVMIAGYIDLSVGSVMGLQRRRRRLPDDAVALESVLGIGRRHRARRRVGVDQRYPGRLSALLRADRDARHADHPARRHLRHHPADVLRFGAGFSSSARAIS